MGLSLVVLVLLGLGIVVEAIPMSQKLVQKPFDERVPGQYIVVIKPEFDADAFVTKLETTKPKSFTNCSILHRYKYTINGFSAKLTIEAMHEFLGMEEVLYVEEDGVVRAHEAPGSWGLDRVDQRYLPLDGQAEFTGDGSGVTVYVLDTGIYPSNTYFGGRASVGFDAIGGGQSGVDCNGHGTHCAGTVGANTYGIARGAALVGVRVLNCLGSGLNSQVLAGIDWVSQYAQAPAVASMSLGGSASDAMDAAVTSLIDSGVLVSVSAGNEDRDACLNSPARAAAAVTVGATDRQDIRAYFSNYGTCLDIFAPGVDITSTWITGATATNTISGTSMACPHVAGAAAIALGNSPGMDPSEVKAKILYDATNQVVIDPGDDSPNRLLYIP